MLEIVDYKKDYAKDVDYLDEKYWGICETERVSNDIKENDIVKLAKIDNQVIGLLHFKVIGDLIDAYHILIDDDYQNKGIGTKLMQEAFKKINKMNIKTIIAHAVEFEGKVNSKKLLEKFGFKEIYRVSNYWNSLYPGEYCKACGSNNCHCGVVVFMKKL